MSEFWFVAGILIVKQLQLINKSYRFGRCLFFLNKQLSLCVTKKTPHISIDFLKKTQHCSEDNEVFLKKIIKKRYRKKYLTLNIHPHPHLVSKW
jgi:hypothetical protein